MISLQANTLTHYSVHRCTVTTTDTQVVEWHTEQEYCHTNANGSGILIEWQTDNTQCDQQRQHGNKRVDLQKEEEKS